MRKQLITVLFVFLVVLTLVYFGQSFLIEVERLRSGFPVISFYVFNATFTILLLIVLTLLVERNKSYDNVGFIYLFSVLLKPALFLLVFKSLFFDAQSINKLEAFSMLLPTLIALFFEVLYCSKILKNLPPKKKIIKG